jgi:hypothetical protein
LSQALAGVMLRWNILALFLIASGMLLACAVYLAVPKINSLLTDRFLSDPPESI